MASLTETFEYRGISFESGNSSITPEKLRAVVDSPKIREWCNNQVDAGIIHTDKVTVNDIKFFGPISPERVGFVALEGSAKEVETGEKIQASYAFIRGESVAVFVRAIVIDDERREVRSYGIFTQQIRYPMGGMLREICAGCVDAETNNLKGVALTELQEELGIIVNVNDLVSLGNIVPSGGGTYETIELYYLAVHFTEEELREKKLFFTDGVETGEKISLIFTPYSDMDRFLDGIGDVKAECAWRRIQNRGL
jgi:hypothetical protein